MRLFSGSSGGDQEQAEAGEKVTENREEDTRTGRGRLVGVIPRVESGIRSK